METNLNILVKKSNWLFKNEEAMKWQQHCPFCVLLKQIYKIWYVVFRMRCSKIYTWTQTSQPLSKIDSMVYLNTCVLVFRIRFNDNVAFKKFEISIKTCFFCIIRLDSKWYSLYECHMWSSNRLPLRSTWDHHPRLCTIRVAQPLQSLVFCALFCRSLFY